MRRFNANYFLDKEHMDTQLQGQLLLTLSLLLQWGHGFSTMDIFLEKFLETKSISLQWGHGFSTMDIKSYAIKDWLAFNASMGPWFFNHGYRI